MHVFFFQAEDGIRDVAVTGVQTCALPICSGMEDRNLWANLPKLKPTDEVKFVIKDREDYEWAVAKIHDHALTDTHTVLLSPVFGGLDPRLLAEWVLADRLPVRLQLQLHKFIWDPEMRGR